MQFYQVAILALAAASSALAIPTLETRDLHNQLYCVDDEPATSFRQGEVVTENNAATTSACNAYKAYNKGTGLAQDSCPDCTVATDSRNGFVTCNSAAKHLGGNEMTRFCKAAGADRGQA